MEKRDRKIMINKVGGTAGENSVNYRVSLPAPWMHEMGVSQEDRDVVLIFKDDEIIIKKK